MSDHLRQQFEGIQRLPELATELSCFGPGQPLSSIRYMANAHSVHVARWLKILAHTKTTISIQTANPIPAFSNGFIDCVPLLPGWLKLPMVLRYALGGLVMRFRGSSRKGGIIHAHGASGNGFMAWLSGQRYVIGIYGSEIYCADERGRVYRWLIEQILQGAERISVCSTEGAKILEEEFNIPRERLYFFHLGYDDVNFRPLDRSERMTLRRERGLPLNEPVWVINRRTHPHYRTHDVVNGFLQYSQSGGPGRLVMLCGDKDAEYTRTICDGLKSHPFGDRVVVVEQMLSAKELASWLQLGDYSVSVPKTDNFSISTLESMGCGTVPILADLEAYCLLRPCQPVRWLSQYEPSDFAGIFTETAKSWVTSIDAQRMECHRFVQDGFSTEGAIRDTAAFYLGEPLRHTTNRKRAA